jgi:hypothetical protein
MQNVSRYWLLHCLRFATTAQAEPPAKLTVAGKSGFRMRSPEGVALHDRTLMRLRASFWLFASLVLTIFAPCATHAASGSDPVKCTSPASQPQDYGRPQVLDLMTMNRNLVGFQGGFTDGRYGYLVPSADFNGSLSGRVVRIDLCTFDTAYVTIFNLPEVTKNEHLKGFMGGFISRDRKYGYLVPNNESAFVQLDLDGSKFGTVDSVKVADVAGLDPSPDGDKRQFAGGFTDPGGKYGYLVPSKGGAVVRVKLPFEKDPKPESLILTGEAANTRFEDGFTDEKGRFAYFVSTGDSSTLVQVDLREDTKFSQATYRAIHLDAQDPARYGFSGAFRAGNYGYLVPYGVDDLNRLNPDPVGARSGKVVRVELGVALSTSNMNQHVTTLNLALVDPGLVGFDGGFVDDEDEPRYAYFVPSGRHCYGKPDCRRRGKAARVDLKDFLELASVKVFDFAAFDPELRGFDGGFGARPCAYFVPSHNDLSIPGYFGKLTRMCMPPH